LVCVCGGVGGVLVLWLRVFWVNVAPVGCVHACSKWQTSANGYNPLYDKRILSGGVCLTVRRGLSIVLGTFGAFYITNPTCHLVKSSLVCGYNPPTRTEMNHAGQNRGGSVARGGGA